MRTRMRELNLVVAGTAASTCDEHFWTKGMMY